MTAETSTGPFGTADNDEHRDTVAEATDSTLSTPSPPNTTSTSGPRAAQKVQTCFCDECENPPARYARLDDSDLED